MVGFLSAVVTQSLSFILGWEKVAAA